MEVFGKPVEVFRYWSPYSVRTACVSHEFYTLGNNDEYRLMLRNVSVLRPTLENLYSIALDISRHSERVSVSRVMSALENDAVITCYSVEEEFENAI